ncbi:MAG TPA: DsbE family thiol:disulfide interchange protein [Burkholderiaceae bacterium]|nr:DsbE family thiol:disulfide interchange protein [Burkholderiaceae bacterium]
MRTLKYVVPAAVFAVLAAFLLLGLKPGRDPREIPSPLIGRPAPAIALPALAAPGGEPKEWSSQAMAGRVWLLNVFASWCVPCLVEHPVLLQMRRDGVVPIVGYNYKDEPGAATGWLAKHGDPYTAIVADRPGSSAIDWGVYGVPETFLIDREGTIRFKHVGPLTPEIVSGRLMPLIRELSR